MASPALSLPDIGGSSVSDKGARYWLAWPVLHCCNPILGDSRCLILTSWPVMHSCFLTLEDCRWLVITPLKRLDMIRIVSPTQLLPNVWGWSVFGYNPIKGTRYRLVSPILHYCYLTLGDGQCLIIKVRLILCVCISICVSELVQYWVSLATPLMHLQRKRIKGCPKLEQCESIC